MLVVLVKDAGRLQKVLQVPGISCDYKSLGEPPAVKYGKTPRDPGCLRHFRQSRVQSGSDEELRFAYEPCEVRIRFTPVFSKVLTVRLGSSVETLR